MTLGIITCSEAINYGTMLQAMALQKTIEKMGMTAEIIDYRFLEKNVRSYSPLAVKSPKSKAAALLFYYIRRKKALAFDKFRNETMKMSSEIVHYNNEKEMKNLYDKYDLFCTGSDQVWNPKFKSMKGFLLEFLPDDAYRFSYASSIGIPLSDQKYIARLRNALSKFAYISVREKGACELIGSLLDREVYLVLDPTLLLNSEEWRQYEEEVCVGQDYVLVYMMNHSPSLLRFAIEQAKKRNSLVYLLSDRFYAGKRIKNLLGISPQQFLYLYRNAGCIVTNSFHGTAFAINFQKEFWVEYPCEHDDRLETVLNLLKLDTRRIDSDHPEPIDFNKTSKLLQLLRKKSIDYLEGALRNGKQQKCKHNKQ